MEDLQNKDKTIQIIWSVISKTFGTNFFSIVNFWEADNYALGFKKDTKLIYISTWNFREYQGSEIKCYSEFEIIDAKSLDTKKNVKQMNEILLDNLLDEMKNFIRADEEKFE